jgi:predicted subunit of tRNA(5-methylaminomethyl-2-thiouridylate) methyltransferase
MHALSQNAHGFLIAPYAHVQRRTEHMRVYIDLPPDIVEKAHTLALKEDRFPKQQIEHLAKRAIEEAFRDCPTVSEESEVADAPAPVA